jgi:hypothetical protein
LVSVLLWHSSIATAQVSQRYVNALVRAKYTVYSGDYNSDGHIDILAKATPAVIPIALDDLNVPIVFFPSPTFVLLSSGSTYTLDYNPSSALKNSAVWQLNTHDLSFGDLLGNGAGAMLIRSKSTGGTSFTVSTSPSDGKPQFVQAIGANDLGLDLGTSGVSVQLKDTNRDGRADLIVRTNGLIAAVFVADAGGAFQRPTDSAGSITASWRALCAALDAGDPTSALSFISTYSGPKYSSAFANLGSDLAGLTQYWSDIQAVTVSTRYATYLLTQNLDGQERGYLITFVNENGRWVVEQF